MNEGELANALLRFDAGLSTQPDPRQQVRDVLRRDRVRIRILTGVTVILWLAALGSTTALVWTSVVKLFPRLDKALQDAGKIPADHYQQIESTFAYVIGYGATFLAASVGVLALAALGTILLVFTARRATIRQVNATLIDISEQLKNLRKSSGDE